MIGFLLGFLMHPWFWFAAIALAIIVAAMVYLKQTALLIKIATNPHLWMAALAVVFYLNIAHMQHENAALKQQVTELQNQRTSDQDATNTDKNRVKQQAVRQAKTERNKTIIDNAQPGQAQDDLLDQYAADRPDLNGGSSASADGMRKRPDGVVKP